MMLTWSTSLNEGGKRKTWKKHPYRIRTDAYNIPFEKRRAITGQTNYGVIITIVYTVEGEAVRPFSVQIKRKEVERYKRMRKGKQ